MNKPLRGCFKAQTTAGQPMARFAPAVFRRAAQSASGPPALRPQTPPHGGPSSNFGRRSGGPMTAVYAPPGAALRQSV